MTNTLAHMTQMNMFRYPVSRYVDLNTTSSQSLQSSDHFIFKYKNLDMYCAILNLFVVFGLFLWNVYLLHKNTEHKMFSESESESESEKDNKNENENEDECDCCCRRAKKGIKIVDYTNKMKRFSYKIHKLKAFDDIFQQYISYNKSKKEGKNFTYNYRIRNAVMIDDEDRQYFVITGSYHNNNLSFTFGTDEYYENNDYNGFVLYCGNIMTVNEFVDDFCFDYIDKKSMCDILNLYYDVFVGFNDKAYWHY